MDKLKYGHSEVGNFTLEQDILDKTEMSFSQLQLGRLPTNLIVGKWVIRTLAKSMDLMLTFCTKNNSWEKAGSGMHIHTRVVKDNKNMYVGENGCGVQKGDSRNDETAPSLTAVGNTNPTSYLRLVPHQEALTTVCWG